MSSFERSDQSKHADNTDRSNTGALRVAYTSVLALIAAVALSGCCTFCKCCHPPGPIEPPCTPPALGESSLVIHDPVALAVPFRFERTMEQIIAESGTLGSTTPAAMLQTLLDSFNATSFPQPVLLKPIAVDPDPVIAGLSATDMLNPTSPGGMVPVALFNRFDLAPADGSNCGEYRIVYAMNGGPGRFFMIFESRLPNPVSGSGIAGCKPVADFWAARANDPNDTTRVAHLESFYYVGLPAAGFEPVVTHANYGLPLGQVRTNFIMGGPWRLREARTALTGGIPAFVTDTVKDSPLVEWFRAPAGLPSGITVADQTNFRDHFLNKPVCNLMRPDRVNPAATASEIVNGIGGDFADFGNDFQSQSDLSDAPASGTDAALSTQIDARLTQLAATTANAQQLLNRAGAMTCGGCHEFSNNQFLNNATPPVEWPPSLGFVHVDEGGNLSPALTSAFLPRRQEILTSFICNPTAQPVPSADCPLPTAGGGGAGSGGGSAMLAATSLPSAAGLDPEVVAKLRRGRTASYFKEVDDARMALLAAASRAAKAPDRKLREAENADIARANKALEAAVLRARAEERALPGAFIPVRRTH